MLFGGIKIGDWGLGIGDWAQSPIPNPQSPLKYYFCILKIGSLFLILVALTKIVILDWKGLISDFIALLIVLILLLCLDDFIAGLLIFMEIFNAFHAFVFIGQLIQNTVLKLSNKFSNKASLLIGAFVIESFSAIYYILAIVITFYLYREIKFCKANFFDQYRKIIINKQ